MHRPPGRPFIRRAAGGAFLTLAAALAGASPLSHAQESPSFRVDRAAFNSGGRPDQGATASSATFRVSIDALGDVVAGGTVSGPVLRADSGLLAAWRPAGEVNGVRFDGATSLLWEPERSVGSYRVFRAALSDAGTSTAPACLLDELQDTSAVVSGTPGADAGFFYLIVAANRLGEAGTPGFASDGAERPGGTCP